MASNATSSQSSNLTVVQQENMTNANITKYDSTDSISSIDSNELNANALLQQCIQDGIGKASTLIEAKTQQKNSMKKMQTNHGKRSQLPTFKVTTSQLTSNHRSRSTKRDEKILEECINKGIDHLTRNKTSTNQNNMQNVASKPIEIDNLKMNQSKNVKTTSAIVSHIVGVTDVVKIKRKDTNVCEQDQYQMEDTMTQTTNLKKDQGKLNSFCVLLNGKII